ncbi:hypothetical protein AB0A77_17495 [Streptomyces varsoviensis]|uniref:hypothetical protein n=1 Tax=Streptomyces varsoviensis TaxID=67373 RepID=UPI0033CD088D
MTTHHINLTVLHDSDVFREALVAAVATADACTEPGLRRALELLDTTTRDDHDIKVRWARACLRDNGIEPGDTGMRAVKALRSAAPGLGLKDAVKLVELAAGK